MNKQIAILHRLAPHLKFDPTIRSRHLAGLFDKDRLIITRVNSRKSHPFQKKYGRNPNSICIHAEIAVIHAILVKMAGPNTVLPGRYDIDDLAKMSLAVIRYHPIHGLLNSKPCEGCMRCITEFGIQRLTWS